MCKRCPFTSSATDSFIIIIYASDLLNYGCCFGVLLGPGKILVTPNKVYAGSNKLDLISGPEYVHPTEKQCNYNYTHPLEKQCNYSVNVVNSLVSGSTTDALSAYQGNLLSQRIAALEDDIDPSRMVHLASIPLTRVGEYLGEGINTVYTPQISITTRNYSVLYIEATYNIDMYCSADVLSSGTLSVSLGTQNSISSDLLLFSQSIYYGVGGDDDARSDFTFSAMKSFIVYPSATTNLYAYTNKEHTSSLISNITHVYGYVTYSKRAVTAVIESGTVSLEVYAK